MGIFLQTRKWPIGAQASSQAVLISMICSYFHNLKALISKKIAHLSIFVSICPYFGNIDLCNLFASQPLFS